MGFETTRFDQTPAKDFYCPICKDVLKYPMQISTCEHIFCSFCITKWTAQNSSCPVDRIPFTASQELRETSRFFRDQYNQLRIRCIFTKTGCQMTAQIQHVISHEGNCSFNPDLKYNCEKGCGKTLSKAEYSVHNCYADLRNVVTELQSQLSSQSDDICALQQIIIKNEMALNACEAVKQMVMMLNWKGVLRSTRVENVMLAVDRKIFCPSNPYEDEEQSINYGATISQPSIHATVLELLQSKLNAKAKVLDIGSGSGYLTVCMALMVGSDGQVIGIDHVRQLTDQSNSKIREHFSFLRESQISFVTGDGRGGYNAESPYDVINYGGAIDEVPQIVIDQLKPNGRILAPLRTTNGHKLITIDKLANGVIFRQDRSQAQGLRFCRIGDLYSQLNQKFTQ